MRVHSSEKWLAIPYEGGTMVLQGIFSQFHNGALV
jgi:hypothetical protein